MSRPSLNSLRLVLSVLGLLSTTYAGAAPIVAGTDLVPSLAVQTIELFPGTLFNPTTSPIEFVLTANGSFTVDRAAQVGSTINFTIPTADFKGSLPSFLGSAPFDLEAGSPGLNPSSGAITNVVQNPLSPGYPSGSPSSFVSGDFTANTYFQLVLANGATIYSNPSTAAVFKDHVLGLPFPVGTTLTSPDAVDLYLQLGSSPNPSSDLLVGESFDRFVTVTPEPASSTLLAIGMAGMSITAWRRRKKTTRNEKGNV